MITLIAFLATLWLVFGLRHWLSCRPSQPTIMTHQLSDRDRLVVVQENGHVVYVGMYSEGETREVDDSSSWYRSIADRRN
jgi:hypothetical protein